MLYVCGSRAIREDSGIRGRESGFIEMLNLIGVYTWSQSFATVGVDTLMIFTDTVYGIQMMKMSI